MAQNLGTWLMQLGNDGAARNAAAACAEQRAAQARTDALMRRFSADRVVGAARRDNIGQSLLGFPVEQRKVV